MGRAFEVLPFLVDEILGGAEVVEVGCVGEFNGGLVEQFVDEFEGPAGEEDGGVATLEKERIGLGEICNIDCEILGGVRDFFDQRFGNFRGGIEVSAAGIGRGFCGTDLECSDESWDGGVLDFGFGLWEFVTGKFWVVGAYWGEDCIGGLGLVDQKLVDFGV